jgi:hypothetical protein
MAASSMEQLAAELAAKKIGSVFIYTNEAHPGEHYPHHTSFEQKMAHAKAFKDHFNLQRPILLDALDGACHLHYGGMPNMSWIFDRVGRVLYKADWTSIDSIKIALHEMDAAVERRRESGQAASPFRVERLEYRPQDRAAFRQGLERNGPRAVTEFEAQTQRWQQRSSE